MTKMKASFIGILENYERPEMLWTDLKKVAQMGYRATENAEFYAELLPFAKEHGVKIATENTNNTKPPAQKTTTEYSKHEDITAAQNATPSILKYSQ